MNHEPTNPSATRKVFLMISLSICFVSVACSNFAQSNASKSQEKASTTVPFSQQRVTTIGSVIRDGDSLLWKSKNKSLPKQESLTSIQFLDEKNGWIATHEGSLYRTSTGGDNWERIKLPISKDVYISSLFFANAFDGWITFGFTPTDVLKPELNQAWILATSDGGKTWNLKYERKGVQITRIRFSNQQEGWAVGRQFVMRDTLQTAPFLIRTIDAGTHWVDLSSKMPITEPGNGISDVHADSPSHATLLTGKGELFRTIDGGQDWQQLTALQNEPEQTYMGRLVKLATGAFLAVGGADSLEGFWGVLIRREPDGALSLYRTNCYISDLLSISETNFLVAGHIVGPASRSNTQQRQGVILHSSDGGQTWSIVYRGSVPINALTFSDSNEVWAVGERGLVLSLEIP